MENTNKIERSPLWNQIYYIVSQIPMKELQTDAVDAQSASSTIEHLVEKYVLKSDKWDKLNEKVSKFYDEDNTEYYDEMGLVSIGEICASHLGYL